MSENINAVHRKRVSSAVLPALCFFCLCLALLCGCEGPEGPPGPVGAVGPPGSYPVITVEDNILTIQDAIDSLPESGGTVYIKAGIYNIDEGLRIDRSDVALIGEPGTVLILSDHVNQPVILVGDAAETPTTVIETIKISGIEIDGNRAGQDSEIDPNRVWIRNNGIDIRMVHDLTISNINVHDAVSGGIVASWQCRGLFLDNLSSHNNQFDGMAFYDSENILISNFICHANDAAGLSLDNDLSYVIFDNGLIRDNIDVGIFARHAHDISFHDLIISGNHSHGAFISHVTEGTGTGVTRLVFESCSFIENNGYGFWLDSPATDSPNNALMGCLFSGNADDSIRLHNEGVLDMEGNIFQ